MTRRMPSVDVDATASKGAIGRPTSRMPIGEAQTVLAGCVRLAVSTLAVRPERARSTAELRTILEVEDWRWKQIAQELLDHPNVLRTGHGRSIRYQYRSTP